VTRNDAESRYELSIDGSLAQLVYRERGDRLELVHTEVPDDLGGRGVGGQLARFALDDALARGLTVVPYCPFVQSWLERHPDVAERQPIAWP
jgi:predicted GNAT family acetyltransferase